MECEVSVLTPSCVLRTGPTNTGNTLQSLVSHIFFPPRPLVRFDKSADEFCYPAEATNANNGLCSGFDSEAPIYYKIVRCGDFLKLAWHLWYGLQRGCDPLGVDHGHDDDWEHITINFVRDNQTWQQDSVTFSQHGGHYTRRNVQQADTH